MEEHEAENNKLLDVRTTPQKRHTKKADNDSMKRVLMTQKSALEKQKL